MPVYMIVEIKILDRKQYSEYITKVQEIVERHGGRYIVRGGEVTPFLGDWRPERVIVIEFESLTQWENCFRSPEYHKIAHLREESTLCRAIVVQGYQQPCIPNGKHTR
jgi:uncharacterized protein (DUF1330 family)